MLQMRSRVSTGRVFTTAAALVLASSAAVSVAQPVLVISGVADDLSANGNKTTGLFFDATAGEYAAYVWERGVGYTAIPGTGLSVEPLRGSSDLSVLATGKNNTSDWGNLNCFAGYCTFGDCVPGTPLPPPSPCQIPTIAHSWSSATGWVNAGSIARELDAMTGRSFGGTRCDSNINSANDISGNGRYIVGGAWTAGLFNSSGDPSFGLCGDFAAFIADRTLGTVSPLPVQPGTTTSRADSVNHDGTVITGYDYGEIIDPVFGPGQGRRACVWVNGNQQLIDDLSGSSATYPVNSAGTVIVGTPGPAFAMANFGIEETVLVKWTRQPGDTWTAQNLGRPADFFNGTDTIPLTGLIAVGASDDGSTVIANARYGGFWDGFTRGIIWRADINGGVPMDLSAYIASIAPTSDIVRPGFSITSTRGISTDGNAITVSVNDAATTCTPADLGLATGNSGVLYLNGGSIDCDAPRIAIPPRDMVSTQYTPFGVALNVFASGSWPMTYTWQREDPQNPGQWLTLTEACSGFPYGGEWDYEGISKSQMRVGQALCGNGRDGNYRVIVSNSCGSVTSPPASVTFLPGSIVTEQPSDVTTCPETFSSVFSVAISNSAELSTQWEIADSANPTVFMPLGDGFNVLPDGRSMEAFGTQGQFLSFVAGPSGSASSYVVRCQFLSPCGNATSEEATIQVSEQPVIASQPTAVTVCNTGTATFSASGQGDGPFTYRWQWEMAANPGIWLDISEGQNSDFDGIVRFVGSNVNTGTVSVVRENSQDGAIEVISAVRCVITNGCSTTSDAASLTVTVCSACDSLDFNNDGNIEPLDVDAYFSVLGEGPCLGDTGAGCNDLDFNNDGNIEPLDVDAYFSVLGEGPCL